MKMKKMTTTTANTKNRKSMHEKSQREFKSQKCTGALKNKSRKSRQTTMSAHCTHTHTHTNEHRAQHGLTMCVFKEWNWWKRQRIWIHGIANQTEKRRRWSDFFFHSWIKIKTGAASPFGFQCYFSWSLFGCLWIWWFFFISHCEFRYIGCGFVWLVALYIVQQC